VAAWYLFLRPSDGFAILGTGGLGLAFYAFVIATDVGLVHLMQQRQEALVAERGRATALAKSRELLFRELQHRVANNLQMAAAMVSLQKRSIRDPASRALLDEAAGRLSLIGRTSRSLYDPSGGAVGLEAMLERVARDACEANGRPDVELEVMATTRPVIHPDTAIPVALIVAECIANAIEHGLAGGRAGRIAINIDAEGSDTLISIRDNGGGLPQGFRPEAQDSLGLTIMRALTSQFGGRFTLTDASPGTEARLTIPPGRPTTLPPLRP
jgi:two-component sensor histidine kinase